MQTYGGHKCSVFAKVLPKFRRYSEPVLVLFYTSLNTDISETRKDIKKRSTVFFRVFPPLSYQDIKIFITVLIHFNLRFTILILAQKTNHNAHVQMCRTVESDRVSRLTGKNSQKQ